MVLEPGKEVRNGDMVRKRGLDVRYFRIKRDELILIGSGDRLGQIIDLCVRIRDLRIDVWFIAVGESAVDNDDKDEYPHRKRKQAKGPPRGLG